MNSSKSLYIITILSVFITLISGALWTLGKVNWFTLALSTVGIILLAIRAIAAYKQGKKKKICVGLLLMLLLILVYLYYVYFAFGDFDYTAATQPK